MLLGVLVVLGVALDLSGRWSWWSQTARRRPSMAMTPRLRKFALTAHVASSVGTLGAVATLLALAIVGLTSQDAQTVRAAYIAIALNAWFVIVPFAFTALLTGLVQALGTPWGLLRHYWVVVKLLLTVVTIIVLLLQMDGINYVAGVAAETTPSTAHLLELRRSIRTHAAGGLLVLLVPVALSLYKPQGLTRYGWRRQHEQRALSEP